MLRYLIDAGRPVAILVFLLWAGLSAIAFFAGAEQVFSSMGALLLCLGFAVFLTARHRTAEARRLWDTQVEVQLRMIWRYARRQHQGARQTPQPEHSLDEIERQIENSFDTMIDAKTAESDFRTYRTELVLSIVGTLQWGFGPLIMGVVHG